MRAILKSDLSLVDRTPAGGPDPESAPADGKASRLNLSSRMLLLVAPVTLLLAVTLVAVFAVRRYEQSQTLRIAEAEALGRTYAALLTPYVVDLNTPGIPPIMRAIGSTPPVNCAVLSFEAFPQSFFWPGRLCAAGDGNGQVIVTPMLHDDQIIARLTIQVGDAQTRRDIWRSLYNDGALLAAVMVAAGLVLLLALRRHVARPIEGLTKAMMTLSGGSIDFEIPCVDRRDELGAMARALAIFRDTKITAERTAETLAEAQNELIEQAKFASLGNMVAGVAHELNTPIGVCTTAVSASADQIGRVLRGLENGELTEEELKSFLLNQASTDALVERNLKRAAGLVKSFKEIAVEQTLDRPHAFLLDACLGDIANTISPELKKRGATLKLICPPNIKVTGSPSAMWQIFSNLIMNSLLHGFDSRAGTITISVREAPDSLIEIVHVDDGEGMPEAVASRIFEPFFTTRRGQGGTGLGMTIVYNLVTRALGGRILCTSDPGRGTRFTLTFPKVAPGA